MPPRSVSVALMLALLAIWQGSSCLLALNPETALSQYTRTLWTQADGLPQDSVRAISQTTDGYLWLGTDEGLARFNGYDFVVFGKRSGSLPHNSVTTLLACSNGSLWIGTQSGLALYSNGEFKTFTTKDGLPSGSVTSLAEDADGVVWIVSGGLLTSFQKGVFTTYPKNYLAGIESSRTLFYDSKHRQLWVGGIGGVEKRVGDKFSPVLGPKELEGNIITKILPGKAGLWLGGTKGIILIGPDGQLRRFTTRDGLPSEVVRAFWEDQSGSLWVGTLGGLSRLKNGRFINAPANNKGDQDWVWSMFEDREGDLWIGMNSALNRLRDDRFIAYGRSEGLPSDEPLVVHEDVRGKTWVGYHDSGLVAFDGERYRVYTTRDGLPSNQVFSIRDGLKGDLLIATWGGLSRMRDGMFSSYSVPDPAGRTVVFDVIEDARGRLWAATANGVYVFEHGVWRAVVRGAADTNGYTITLTQRADGSIWAGTLSKGLWQVTQSGDPDAKPRLYTIDDGLGSNQIRSLYEDREGTLWIGTFGGGLSAFRNGVFHHYDDRDGLLSNNVAHVEEDDKDNLWLSTTRGVCRVPKQQLKDFAAGRIHVLTPENYGIADGLRSTQCAPAYPAGGGGTRTRDGRLWFPTARGLAIINPNAGVTGNSERASTPITHIVEVTVDGRDIDFSRAAKLKPGTGQVRFRYAGTYLSAPERVQNFYKLEGLDDDWIAAGSRRVVNYNPLPRGRYKFMVRSSLPGGGSSESQFAFEVLPHFYQTSWFILLSGLTFAAAVYGMFYLRLMQVRGRFALIFEERARVAREIHDTLAQGFVGISAQLDALAIKLNGDMEVAKQHLDLARKMARYSLTEARRSVMDLRTSDLQNQDLPAAVRVSARRLVAGTEVDLRCEFEDLKPELPPHIEQNVLRIAQEALTNAVKHAQPNSIEVQLKRENGFLCLRVKDDGRGFESAGACSVDDGHFGIVGMQERAERSGGKFSLSSQLGSGTLVEVKIPVCAQKAHQ